jgi:predicted outer membrane repeat protein
MTISNTQINNNEEIVNNFHLWGGAISNEGRLTLIKCTLNNNKATDGGAIYNEGYLNIQKSTLSKNSIEVTIEENDYPYSLVKGNGGAIYNIGTLIINNSSLYSNSIKVYNDTGDNPGYGYGGAICSEDGTVTITNSQINYNTADYGGAISIMNGTMTLKNNNINYNTAKGTGGAISTFDEESNYGDFKLNIINCNINYNYAKGDGGAIWNGEWVYVGGDVTIINSKINNNKANQDAGAICNSGYMKITSSSINNNKVTDKDGFGGAIFNTYDLNITNCKFNNNSAVYGGAIANPTDVTITSSVFTNNKANYGGAIYTAGGQGNGYLNVTYSTFLSNGKYDVYNGNDEYTLKNVHCDYNWWGTNNNPLTRLYNCSTTKWIYMHLGTSTTKSKNTWRISLDLNYYTNGKTISRITGTKHVQGITVKITIKSRHLNGVYTGIINNGVYTISKKVNYKELITLTGYTPNKTITKTIKAT